MNMMVFSTWFMYGVKAFISVCGFIVTGVILICVLGLFASLIGSLIRIGRGGHDE